MGPTASGKTGLALALGEQLDCEIISVDSALIYRQMDIGTAKPCHQERAQIPHWLIDIIDPTETYSVAEFYHQALDCINDIISRNRVPVLVGGTMMYFNALINGISVIPETDPTIRELVHQQGKKNNLEIDSGLIEKEMKALRKPYDSDEEFEKALDARNITIDDLKKSMKVDINARKLLNEEIKGKITISDVDVKKYYEENKHKFHRPESYRACHILAAIFPSDMLRSTPVTELQNKKEELTQKAEEKINEIIKELKEGANFEELAKKESDDEASRESGGDLDVIYKGIFDPAFDEAVSKLNPGEISGKVETRFGFHVIKLTEKRPPEQAPFRELEEAIQKHLFMEEAKVLVASYVEDLKKEAKIKTFFK